MHTSGCGGDTNCVCGQMYVGRQRGWRFAHWLAENVGRLAGKAAKAVGLR